MFSRVPYLAAFLAVALTSLGRTQDLTFEGGPSAGVPTNVHAMAVNLPYLTIEPSFAWQREAWDGALNFPLSGPGIRAGDINGDGLFDLVHVVGTVDDRDPEGALFTWKTFVYLGGNLTTEPSQIVYAQLEPVGDLDGDGYADAIESTPFEPGPRFWKGSAAGYVATDLPAWDALPNRRGLPSDGVDLDGDGHLDFLLSTRYSGSHMFHVVYGAADVEDVDFQTVSWVDDSRLSSINMTDAGEGQPILAGLARSWEEPAPSLRIFTLDRQGQFDVLQTISLDGYDLPDLGAVQIYFIDVTGDGGKEIVLERFPNFWREGQDFPLLVFRRDTEAESVLYHEAATMLFDRHVRPIGDLNGDGRHDYLRVDATSTAHVVFGPASLGDPLVLGPRVGTDGQRITPPAEIPGGTFGDVTGNGFDDVVVSFDDRRPFGEDGAFGRIVVEGGTGASLAQYERRYVDTEFYGPEITFTTNIGDVDGDGIDDLAFTALGGRWPAVHFHWSGSGLTQEPDVVMASKESWPLAVAGGDFTGNGSVDVAILWREGILSPPEHVPTIYVAVYLDAKFDAPPHVISSVDAGGETIRSITNAGDLNGDGVDDLLLSGVRTASLFFGGSQDTAPDVQWEVPGGINVVAAIGDVNGDGVDDLAISTHSPVLVYFGRDGLAGTDFSQPDLELVNTLGYESRGFGRYGLTAGDFNGDGFNDIAVLASVNPGVPSEIARPLHIYLGGPAINDTVDALAALPEDPTQYVQQSTFECSELVTLPGVGGDRDGLLLGSCRAQNAYVYLAAESEPAIRAILQAPGPGHLGTNNSVNMGAPFTSAAGDFTGDGLVDVVLPRTRDAQRPGSSTFLFTIEAIDPGSLPVLAQFVHASADPALHSINISMGDSSLADGLRFREASSDMVVPGGTPFNVTVTSETTDEAISIDVPTLDTGTYWLVLTGVSNPKSFAPNPDGVDTGLRIEAARRGAMYVPTVHFVQGVTDLMWMQASLVGASTPVVLFEGEFGSRVEPAVVHVTSNPIELRVTPDPFESRAFRFGLEDLGQEVLLVSTGFYDPSRNSDGPVFDLIAVKPGEAATLVPSFAVSAEGSAGLPTVVALHAGYPNPFNPSTTMAFDLPTSGDVKLQVYDMLGRRVATLIDEHRRAGRHLVTFDAHGLASGTYLVMLEADHARRTQTVVLLK